MEMKINALPSHSLNKTPNNINFKKLRAVQTPDLYKYKPDYELIYSQRAAALSGSNLVQNMSWATIKQNCVYNNYKALESYKRALDVKKTVCDVIKAGEANLFSSVATQDLSAKFDYDRQSENMFVSIAKNSKPYLGAMFNKNGVIVIDVYDTKESISISDDQIVKIQKNSNTTEKGSRADAIYEYKNGRVRKISLGYEEINAGEIENIKEIYEFDLYNNGRWDYSNGVKKIYSELHDDEYTKAKLLYAFDRNGIIARAEDYYEGFFDAYYKKGASSLISFNEGNANGVRHINPSLDKNDWTKLQPKKD